jgi:drug/metabolite transporter (DMT)-like permease
MSAGVAALIIACQPLVTALVVSGWMGEKLGRRQWAGVFIGLAGVALGSLAGTLIALAGVTTATLYQRKFSPKADLKAAAAVQFAVSLAVLAPLALAVEDFQVTYSVQLLASIAFLVIFASILAVSVLHLLMRQGEATRVASMMYLPPVFAVVVEAALFGIVPSGLALAGMAVTGAGVAMTVWSRRWRSSISSS